jgi:SulP family sulfate permease
MRFPANRARSFAHLDPACRSTVLADLVAGTSVALVLIPQCVAYARLAGVPPETGLAAAAAGGIAGSLLTSSPHLQSGPTALSSLLTFGALGALAGGPEALERAMLLALLIGVIRIGLGLARAGALTFFLSDPILAGLLPGAAITIAASQVPDLFGASGVPHKGIFGKVGWTLAHPDAWDAKSVGLSIGALAIMLAGRRLRIGFGSVPLVVLAAIVWSKTSGYDGPQLGSLSVDTPAAPWSLPWGDLGSLLLPAAIIAVVGFVEPATIGRALLERDRRWNADRELVSQGVANLASGFAGGFPVGASFSRTALNRAAGARTRLSGLFTGVLVVAFIPGAGLLSHLPNAIPAAIVAAAVVTLARPQPLVALARSSRTQLGVALATFGLTIALAPRIDRAVAIGIGLAVGVHLWREMRVPIAVDVVGEALHLRPAGVLWFGSANRFEQQAERLIAAHPSCRVVIVHLEGLGRIDLTGARTLARVLEDARRRGLEARVEGIPPVTGGLVGRVLRGDHPPDRPG